MSGGSGGMFSKGGGVPLTPAQVQAQQIATQQAQKNESFWFPIQQYFASKLQTDKGGLEEEHRGEAASTSRAQVSGAMGKVLSSDAAAGSAPGSGKYITDVAKGSEAGGLNAGQALTNATASSDAAYVKGLQTVLSLGAKDQAVAQQGLDVAGREQAQEAGATAAADASKQQGAGEAIGLLAAL